MPGMKKKKPMAMPTKKMKGMSAPHLKKEKLAGATHAPGAKGNATPGNEKKLTMPTKVKGGKGSQKSLGGVSPKPKIKFAKAIGNDKSKKKVRARKQPA